MTTKNKAVADGITRRNAIKGIAAATGVAALRFIEDCLVMDRDEGINQHPRIKTLIYCVETKQFGYDIKVAERHLWSQA